MSDLMRFSYEDQAVEYVEINFPDRDYQITEDEDGMYVLELL